MINKNMENTSTINKVRVIRGIKYPWRFLPLFLFLLFVINKAGAQAPTVADLTASGTNIKWYSASTGGTPLATSTVLVNGQHYYASQTINGCESTTRKDVIANLTTPDVPLAGTHTPSKTQVVWNWAAAANATGYRWNTTNDYNTSTDMGALTTKTEAALTCETAYARYVWSYNSCLHSAALTITQTTSSCWSCGDPLTKSHLASDNVAPVDKTVTYGTVTNIPGATSKCWITRNLGASQQAASATDAAEESAGWYWQWNRKQGYKHDGTTRTPSTAWDATIDGSSTWEAAKDPCTIELGTGWRLPTVTEWNSIVASGSWANVANAYSSDLKLHIAGGLSYFDGTLVWVGTTAEYWSSSSYFTNGTGLMLQSGYSGQGNTSKALGATLRCLKD
jgi:hypothetical protein